jgi:two-component system, sensor histidine kinase and response regulator
LKIELENAKVAVCEQHCEWIVKELLDNSFKSSQAGSPVNIRSQSIDRQFHLWVSDYRFSQTVHLPLEQQELGLSLKIVKKIVDIYDGIFAISTVVGTCDYTAVHITLPLA